MISDKCEMMLNETEECDEVAVGVTEDEVLVCEICANHMEDEGFQVTYYGDDC